MSRIKRGVAWACGWAQTAIAFVEAWADPTTVTPPEAEAPPPLTPLRPGTVLTPEAQAMIAAHALPPQREPLQGPLEGSIEARTGGRGIGRRT